MPYLYIPDWWTYSERQCHAQLFSMNIRVKVVAKLSCCQGPGECAPRRPMQHPLCCTVECHLAAMKALPSRETRALKECCIQVSIQCLRSSLQCTTLCNQQPAGFTQCEMLIIS